MNLGVVLLALITIGTLSGQPSLRLHGSRPPVTAIRGGSHYILVFHSMPTSQTFRDLAARGIRVLQYVPDTGLLVTMPASADLEGFDFAYTTALGVSDKLAPQLHTSSSKYFLLIFHSDVEAARTREIAQSAGFDILNNAALLPNQVLAAGPYSGLETLAGNDEVSYVMPASSELVSGAPLVGCPGGVTGGGSIGEYAVAGKGWSKDFGGVAALKYVIENLTSKMDANMARGEIERALREWTRYASLTFTAAERADTARAIAIRFAVGN